MHLFKSESIRRQRPLPRVQVAEEDDHFRETPTVYVSLLDFRGCGTKIYLFSTWSFINHFLQNVVRVFLKTSEVYCNLYLS